MGKYLNIQNDVYSVFATKLWQAENIKTFPVGIQADSSEYIRINILSNGLGINRVSVSGMLMIDIFIEAGTGPKRAYLIADRLDAYLESKTMKTAQNGSTQFESSNLVNLGVDKDDKSLYRYSYSLPFHYHGVN